MRIGVRRLSHEFSKERIVPIDIEEIDSVSGMLSAFNNTSFQSRNLARCVEIFTKMLEDPDNPTVFLGLAGAMVPAGMKKVISTMVKKKMVNVIVTTGANAYHDLVESFGHYHYKGSPEVNDVELYRCGIDRIYDTFAEEEKYRLIDEKIMMLADGIRVRNPEAAPMSSREFLYELGVLINEEGQEGEKENSFLWNCWRHKVPVFVPALCDSSIGLGLTRHYANSIKKGLKPLLIDQIRDNQEIYEIKKSSKKTGVIYVGGGVPKNYIQQTSYLEGIFGARNRGHDYGFQITTDRPEWGGLSGCTFKEGVSWGKDKHTGEFVACYCDATIALPLIVKAVLERLDAAPAMKRRTER
jgi:deoxyhypusine synthase